MIGVYFAPESPWWLVRQNRPEEAKAVVRRLTSPQNVDFDVDKNVALMVLTTEHEREVNAHTQYSACFRGSDLRRTIIVIGCYCMQVLSGSTLRAYMTYFFQQAGLPTDQSFNMSIVGYALGLIGVIVAVSLWLPSLIDQNVSFSYIRAVVLDAPCGPTYAVYLGPYRLSRDLHDRRRTGSSSAKFAVVSLVLGHWRSPAGICVCCRRHRGSCVIHAGL